MASQNRASHLSYDYFSSRVFATAPSFFPPLNTRSRVSLVVILVTPLFLALDPDSHASPLNTLGQVFLSFQICHCAVSQGMSPKPMLYTLRVTTPGPLGQWKRNRTSSPTSLRGSPKNNQLSSSQPLPFHQTVTRTCFFLCLLLVY